MACWYLTTMFEIEVNNIARSYGFLTIFKGFSCKIESGITGIAGPNGSGKSTLMKCFAGLLKPDSGSIQWKYNAEELEKKQLIQFLGFATPYIQCYPGLTCSENLELIQRLSMGETDSNAVHSVLEKVGLDDKKNIYYGKMSSGQQQRLRLCTALIKNPGFLLLDEPGSNLDKAGYSLVERIVNEARDREKTVVIASNDEKELALCDTIIDISHYHPK